MRVCTLWQTEEGGTERDGQFIPHSVSTRRSGQHLQVHVAQVFNTSSNTHQKGDIKREESWLVLWVAFDSGYYVNVTATPGYTTQHSHIAALLKQIQIQKELYSSP